MIETIIKCDLCSLPGAKTYRYWLEKTMDASGNGYEINWIYKDFCHECMTQFARKNPQISILQYPVGIIV